MKNSVKINDNDFMIAVSFIKDSGCSSSDYGFGWLSMLTHPSRNLSYFYLLFLFPSNHSAKVGKEMNKIFARALMHSSGAMGDGGGKRRYSNQYSYMEFESGNMKTGKTLLQLINGYLGKM